MKKERQLTTVFERRLFFSVLAIGLGLLSLALILMAF